MKRVLGYVAIGAVLVASAAAACGGNDGDPLPQAVDAGSDADTDVAAPDATARESLGGVCTSDDGCEEGLVCWNKGDGDWWPARGLCSKRCADEAECAAVKPGASCYGFGSPDKWCYEPCTFGPAAVLTALDQGPAAGKCHGRADVACESPPASSAPGSFGSCRPRCSDDSGCGGDKCDPKIGGCTAEPIASWDDVGNHVTTGSGSRPCSTDRITRGTSTEAVCTAGCVLGVLPGCGWSGTGKAKAACLLASPQAGIGDGAQCARLCETDCDCEGGRVCGPLPDTFVTKTGRLGSCQLDAPDHLPCADAGADGGDGG